MAPASVADDLPLVSFRRRDHSSSLVCLDDALEALGGRVAPRSDADRDVAAHHALVVARDAGNG